MWRLNLANITFPPSRHPKRLVWTTIIATIMSCFLYSSVSTPYFIRLLIMIHVILFLPLVESPNSQLSYISINVLYMINGVIAALCYWVNCFLLFKGDGEINVFRVVSDHPAISSVGWDVICSTIVALVATRGLKCIALPFAIGVAGTTSYSIIYDS